MKLTINNIYKTILDEASDAFGDGWDSIKNYAPVEFKKMSTQLKDIAKNVAKYAIDSNDGYSPDTGKILLKMQVVATESVLVAISTLTLIAVQNAINNIFEALKNTFSELVPIL
ncbi:hypothetical protein RQM59_06390 [Flavobacteriaceae bacterium S356]|uniref:Uncharacterized protein n=1 Tax=Asprobacillus argus TaxID=3076534 RepID=A0ABU3LE58_9FLAO|nr:hypothetical protein [Flavobacteriaceae bacterium S356]